MNKENSTLKVYAATQICERAGYYHTSYYRLVPQIRLQGSWLAQLGFEEGDAINVQCNDGKLVITLQREEEQA